MSKSEKTSLGLTARGAARIIEGMSLDFIFDAAEFWELAERLDKGATRLQVTGVTSAAKPYLLAALAHATGRGIVFIRPTSASLFRFADETRFYCDRLQVDRPVRVLPALSEDPYQEVFPSLETVAARMRCFWDVLHQRAGVIVTSLFGLIKPFPLPADLEASFLTVETGQALARDRLLEQLAQYGYERTDIINNHGEYARRGGIVDIFSPWESVPSRLEFSGDEIGSLREFDPSTQRSLRKTEFLRIPSLREFPSEPDFVQDWVERARSSPPPGTTLDMEARIASLQDGDAFPSFVYQSLLCRDRFISFSSHLQDHILVLDEFEEVEKDWSDNIEILGIRHAEQAEQGSFSLSPEMMFPPGSWEAVQKKAVRLNELESQVPRAKVRFFFQSVPRFNNKIPFFLDFLKKKQEERERCALFLSGEAVRRKFAGLLAQHQIRHLVTDDPLLPLKDESVALLQGRMSRGFGYPSQKLLFFSERDVFTEERVLISRPRIKPFVSDFRDLQVGDHIVHTDYGIGVFSGLLRMDVEDKKHEFMEIHYRDEDKLFVPVEDMNLVQKYARMGTAAPLLSKLGTPQWERTKERTKKAIEEMAQELLELYARRKAAQGYGFSPAGDWSSEFEQTFAFQETDDQRRAITEVMQDMESLSPMDRLLCGDVGYGKTEVSMRAAFKAVMDSKQVAVLCPTTVLASQHLQTFRRRMLLFPVRVEGLTRLQSRKTQESVLNDLRGGLVDIVIGTHRLLSSDVEFHDLGLLVVDEEQRFGVKHKERIKHIKANIDVLTMTATPIPRTLNMSLSGLRDISLIETPPKDRLAIHTVVTTFNRNLITSAVRRELRRGGQVYFIHNRVEDIESMARMLENWVPEARVAFVHGQMSGPVLEKQMIDFIRQEYNILLSTSIIENGIDIPLVNTLIVNRADRFGLAQLYQLRGRVGRSSRQAAAYFLVPPMAELTPLAKQRLKALKEFSELGSGFRLAAKDLEIRGSGSFLSDRQHGYMEAVGFDYYMDLMEKTIRKLKGEPVEEMKSKINLKLAVRIPESYLPQTNLRLNLYKRISSVDSLEELDRIAEEVRDRYGPLPSSVRSLLRYGTIKHLAGNLRIKTLDRVGSRLVFKFLPDSTADVRRLTRLVERCRGSITPQGVLSIDLGSSGETSFLDETIHILKELSLM
ncbi:MAG: transcription-repair coupling factor [Candidatus Aminicenantaceae bacterium]